MKKTLMVLFAGACALSAVEWQKEQVTHQTEYDSYAPVIALDAAGKVRILYLEWGGHYLKVASNTGSSWDIRTVAQVTGAGYSYSIDVDDSGASYVAYDDYVSEDNPDIFFSTDKGGTFTPVNITNDAPYQVAPVLKLDNDNIPHIVYAQSLNEEDIQLYQGWVDGDELYPEQVTTNLYQDEYSGFDMVFDLSGAIHVFYTGDNYHLWRTTSGEPSWIKEEINELTSMWPSVVTDPMGSFHVAYGEEEKNIHYTTNTSGTWQDEIVSGGAPEGGGDWRPNLVLDNLFGYLAVGKPHIAWIRYDDEYWGDLYYSSKPEGSWVEEAITSEPGKDEWPGYGRYFAIDKENYGHIVYDFPDENDVWQIMYAKSTEPLAEPVAITEIPNGLSPSLRIEGSRIRFDLAQSSSIRLTLYDASGRMINELASGTYPAGQNEITIHSGNLPSGVYFARLESANTSASARMILVK